MQKYFIILLIPVLLQGCHLFSRLDTKSGEILNHLEIPAKGHRIVTGHSDDLSALLLENGLKEDVLKSLLEVYEFPEEGVPFILVNKSRNRNISYLIIEPTRIDLAIVDFRQSFPVVTELEKEYTYRLNQKIVQVPVVEKEEEGIMKGNTKELSEAIIESVASFIDWELLKETGKIKVVYTEKIAFGEVVGIGKIKALQINTPDEVINAFAFERDG